MTEQPSKEVAVIQLAPEPQALTAYGTSGLVQRFAAVANEIAPLIQSRDWALRMGRSEHVKIEGWTCCGAIIGIGPATRSVREMKNELGEVIGYEATVAVVRAADGTEIGSAINECRFSEVTKKRDTGEIVKRWLQADGTPNHHAAKSMAQTRAASKALASWCRPIIEMAGYSGTPAEEMSGVPVDDAPPRRKSTRKRAEKTETPAEEGERAARQDARDASEPYTPEGEWKEWLEDPVPISKGEFANKTWRFMSEGSPGGKRENTLQWIVDEFDNEKHVGRAQRCLDFIRGESF